MAKYRKKPVVIEAMRWSGNDANDWRDAYDFCKNAQGVSQLTGPHPVDEASNLARVSIVTLGGVMFAEPGDWIIKGIKGEFYPCKSDIFEATYERVATDGSGVPVSEVQGDKAS
jgi:hypothetical protein